MIVLQKILLLLRLQFGPIDRCWRLSVDLSLRIILFLSVHITHQQAISKLIQVTLFLLQSSQVALSQTPTTSSLRTHSVPPSPTITIKYLLKIQHVKMWFTISKNDPQNTQKIILLLHLQTNFITIYELVYMTVLNG